MALIKFTLDEIEFAKAVVSLKRSISGRGVRTIQCSLTKTHLKLDAGTWGKVRVPVKSDKTSRFIITPSALGKAASAYRNFKRGSTSDAFAVMNKKQGYLKTYHMSIPLK